MQIKVTQANLATVTKEKFETIIYFPIYQR